MTQAKWKKTYHDSYRECLKKHDFRVSQYITSKEDIVASHPVAYSYLGNKLRNIRKFKSGKLRILYALSTELPSLWEHSPQENEILFLYIGFRDERTYMIAEKLLKKHNVIF